jgi:hypothetical protein
LRQNLYTPMTWIVGTSTPFGYSFALSDVRVTLGDGREIDCLQKINPVARFIAVGFAGSVKIGFDIVEALKASLYEPDDRVAWNPPELVVELPPMLRKIFQDAAAEEQANHSHIMLLSTHPTEPAGSPWASACVHVLRSPDFTPEEIKPHQLGTIGCHTFSKACVEAIERFSIDPQAHEAMMQGEVGPRGGLGSRLGMMLTPILEEAQPRGISPHLHECWVYRGKIVIGTNNHVKLGRWSAWNPGVQDAEAHHAHTVGTPETPGSAFAMPQVATSWEQLLSILEAYGGRAAGAVA